MPEPSRRSRRNVQTLALAHEVGQLVRVRCMTCNIRRHYLPVDLMKLVGDIPFWDVERHMRCEGCGRKELDVDLILPTAKERAGIRVRRLVEVRMIKRPVWRAE